MTVPGKHATEPAASPERLDGRRESARNRHASLSLLPKLGQLGPYELLGRLARGGMAEVFLAREVSDAVRRYVVVKRILPEVAADPQFVAMFKDEVRLAMQLNHPHICHMYAAGVERGVCFQAIEWVDGMPLARIIEQAREKGGLPMLVALKIIAQIADALDYAHRACDGLGEPLGIVHRDVSPQNIMVAFDGRVKLLDFGIAKASSHSAHTEAGLVKGKYAYMSPQQCIGDAIDARADVFALGTCLYEALTGRNPFARASEFETMRAIVEDDVTPIRELLSGYDADIEWIRTIDQLLARALAKRAEDRYPSTSEMQFDLERILSRSGEVVTATRISEVMQRLFVEEIRRGPDLESTVLSTESAPGARSTLAGLKRSVALESAPPTAGPRPSGGAWLAPVAFALACSVALAVLFLVPDTLTISEGTEPTHSSKIEDANPPAANISVPALAGAPRAVTPNTASMYIDSSPPGATVELGERGVIGTAPIDAALLAPGDWEVRLRLPGHGEWSETVSLEPGERTIVRAILSSSSSSSGSQSTRETREPRAGRPREENNSSTAEERRSVGRGHLSINTRPWSRVYLGDRLLGTTPLGDLEVPAGTLRLHLIDRDGREHLRTVTIEPQDHEQAFFDLHSSAPEEPSN